MMKISRPTTPTLWLLWHCVAIFAVVLIPSQFGLAKSIWSLSPEHLGFFVGIGLTYLASVLVLTLAMRRSDLLPLRGLAAVAAIFGGYFLFLLITKSYYSRPLLIAALALSALFILLPFLLKESVQKVTLSIVAAATLLLQFLGATPNQAVMHLLGRSPGPHTSTKAIETALYSIKATLYDGYISICPGGGEPCHKPRNGGGVSPFHGGYLVATGEGSLHHFRLPTGTSSLAVSALPYRVPLNSDAFESGGGRGSVHLFRVTDILVHDLGGVFRLFTAHHYWKVEQNCFVLRVSSAGGNDAESFLRGEARLEWRTVYETAPCLPLKDEPRSRGPFAGGESGGRLVLLDQRRLLLSVGDHDFNGWHRDRILSQQQDASYGKTILIDVGTGAAEVYSSGHRNPQGLFVDQTGSIWLTEHGPEGGDELNLVLRGANYGWPFVTYGTASGQHGWPLSTNPGEHDGFRLPVFAWLPDIAVSDVIRVQGGLFRSWQNDLLVASLKKALWRIRLREGRVVYVEPIEIRGQNARVRDITEGTDGRIVLWLDNGSIAALEPALGEEMGSAQSDSATDLRGQLLFARCTSCHSVKDGASHAIGPDLAGVVERRIAGAAGYSYSRALASRSGTWSVSRLDEFLANPQRFAPGTSMQFEGISDRADRRKLIDYLETLK